MPKRSHVISYWLLPEIATRKLLAQEIGALAARFGAPMFAPHVTVFIGPENSRRPAEVLREIGSIKIELTISGIRFSEQFTKTVFVQFERSDPLQELGDKIWKVSGGSARYVIDPHLSLLYANVSTDRKQKLADEMDLPFSTVQLTSICAVRCARPTTTSSEVEKWKLLAS